MSFNLKKSFRTGSGFLLAALFLYLAFRGTNLDELWDSLRAVNYWWIALLLPVHVVSHWVRAKRWAYLLAPVKRDPSTRNLFSAVMIGFMVNNILPRVGEFVRPYVIGKLEGISKTSAFGTVVIERILDMMTFFFLLCLVLFLYPSSLSAFFDDVQRIRPVFLLGSVGSLVLFGVLFLKSESLVKLLGYLKPILPHRYAEKFERLVDAFRSGFGVARMRESFIVILALSLFMWGMYALGLYLPFFAYESLTHHALGIGDSFILLTITTIAFVLPAPGAMGTYHSFMTFTLVKMYGVDNITALSYSIVTHEAGYIITSVGGLFYFLRDHLKVSEVTLEAADGEVA